MTHNIGIPKTTLAMKDLSWSKDQADKKRCSWRKEGERGKEGCSLWIRRWKWWTYLDEDSAVVWLSLNDEELSTNTRRYSSKNVFTNVEIPLTTKMKLTPRMIYKGEWSYITRTYVMGFVQAENIYIEVWYTVVADSQKAKVKCDEL